VFVPGRNSRLQLRRFREFRNTDTDIEKNFFFMLKQQHYTLKLVLLLIYEMETKLNKLEREQQEEEKLFSFGPESHHLPS